MAYKSVEERIAESRKNRNGGTVKSASDVESRIKRSRQERTIDFDTFETDLAAVSDLVNKVYGGWQSVDDMKSSYKTVSAMRDRLDAHRGYTNDTGNGQDLTKYNESMDKLIAAYDTALSDWNALSEQYAMYQDADSYGVAKKNAERYNKYKGLDFDGVQKAIKDNPDDADFLSRYGINVGFDSKEDAEKEINTVEYLIENATGAEKKALKDYRNRLYEMYMSDPKSVFKASEAFADGHQPGDVMDTIGATVADAVVKGSKGLFGMLEGITDFATYGVAGAANLLGADKFSDTLKGWANENAIENLYRPYEASNIKKDSVLGGFGSAVMEGVGQMIPYIATAGAANGAGIGKVGQQVLSSGSMFASSAGSGMSEAYRGGATDGKAIAYGLTQGVIEAGTEMLSGGLGKAVNALGISRGIAGLDDMFAKKLTGKISNFVMRNAAEFGIKATGEGAEEVIASLGSAVAKKLTYMSDEDLRQLIKDEDLLYQFLVGTASSAVLQSPSLAQSYKYGTDFVTGRTAAEEFVITSEFESRLADAEKDGKKLSTHEKNVLYRQVEKDLTAAKEEAYTAAKRNAPDAVGRVASMDVSDTVDNSTGNSIKVQGIRTDDSGNTVLKTNMGERTIDSVTLNRRDAELVAMAEGMEESRADLFVSMYNGQDATQYKDSFDMAYAYGKNAFGVENAIKRHGVLTESQALQVYKLGVSERTAAPQKKADAITEKYFSEGGTVKAGTFSDKGVNYKKLNSRQKAAASFAKMFSKATGVNVVLFESEVDENGVRKAENGRYDKKTNTVHIDVYAGFKENEGIFEDSMIPTMSHEITHWMKEKAPEAYAKLSEIVMDTLSREHNARPEALVAYEKQNHKKRGRDVSDEYAQDELIARACEDMLSGNKTANEIIEQMDEETAKTFSEKFKEVVAKIRAWLKELLGVYKSGSEEAKILRRYDDKLAELQKAWDEGLEKAIKANHAIQNSEAEDVAASERTQNSDRNTDDDLSEIESRFYNQLKEWLNGTMPKDGFFDLGTTPDLLLKHGAKRLPIVMENNVVWKFTSNYKDHGIALDEVAKLPSQIANPILLLRGSVPNSFVILTELEDKKGREVIVALHLNKHHKRLKVNRVASIYGKDKVGVYVENQINNGNLLYADKKRSEIWFTNRGLQLPKLVQTLISTSDNSIHQNASEVNEQFSDRDSNGNGLTPGQVEFFKDCKIRDENGNLKVMYHGTGRADRVGYHFREDRATSGPMAFFTDNKRIADNYAKDKNDTSIAYDDMYRDYYTQFRIEVDGKNLSVVEAWDKLPISKKVEIRKKAPHVTFDEDMENIVYDENADRGTGGFDKYRINEHGGNYLSALVGEWLEDGTLYGQEEEFLKVLSLVGLDDVQYMNPYMRAEKTYEVYLNVTNPFVTTEISPEMVNAFKEAAETAEYVPGNTADMWDKRNVKPSEWIERLERGIAEGNTHVWTSIPDFVTNVLKTKGYDGIVDEGGKMGGEGHTVVIPFYSNQVKDITNQNPTENEDIRYSDRQTESIYDAVGELKRIQRENDKLKADIERLRKKNRLERTVTGATLPNDSEIAAVASYILNNADSGYDKKTLVGELKEIYSYMQTEDIEWHIAMSKMLDVAQDIAEAKKERTVTDDYAKTILSTIRSARVSFNDTQKAEAEYAYGKNWNRNYFGRVTVANDGIPLESAWSEWAAMYPDVFDADISDADMVTALLDIYDSTKTSSEIVETYNKSEAAREIAFEIYNKLWTVSPVRTLADKHDKEVKRLKFEHRQEMKELRDRKDAEVFETRWHYSELIHKVRDARDEKIAQLKKESHEYTKQYREKVERRNQISQITKKSLKLNTWLKNNSKKEHVVEELKEPVAAVLRALDFSSESLLGTGEPTQKDISLKKAFAHLYKKMKDIDDGQGPEDYSLDMPIDYVNFLGEIKEQIDGIVEKVGDNQFVLRDMTLEQLQDVNKMLSILSHIVRSANKALADANGKAISNMAQSTMLYADSLGEKNKKVGTISNFLNFDNALPVYFFKMMGDGGQQIFRNMQNGWDKMAFHVKQIIDYSEACYEAKDVNKWSKEVHDFKFADGSKVKITTAQIMSLYCLQKREQARNHLIRGGIRVANFKIGTNTITNENGALLLPHEIDKVVSTLTERQKKVADDLQKFMNTVCSDWGNEVSMRRFGIKSFGEENYFPIQSDANVTPSKDSPNSRKGSEVFRLLNMDFTKELNPNASNRIMVDNIFDVFATHTSDMAKYNALALPVLDMFRWYSYKETYKFNPEDPEDKRRPAKTLRQSLESAYGDGATKYIFQFMKDINGAHSGGMSSGESFAKKMTSNYKVAAVGANLRVALLQPTAYARASVVLDPKYLAKGLTKLPQIEKAKKTCGIALWKSLGFYDTNISRGITDQIKHEETWVDWTRDKAMKLAEWGDSITWGLLYNACEAEVNDNLPGLSGKAKDAAIAERLREVIYMTQVVDSTMTRTQMMRSKSFGSQMLTSFMSEPMMSYNILHDCYIQYNADKRFSGSAATALKRNGKKIVRATMAYLITSLAAAMAGGAADYFRDNDEEKDAETYFVNVKDNMLSDIFGMLPLMRDVYSGIQGYSPTRMDEAFITSTISAIKKIFKSVENGEWDYKTTYSVTKAFSQITGLPLGSLLRDVIAIWNSTVGEVYGSVKVK